MLLDSHWSKYLIVIIATQLLPNFGSRLILMILQELAPEAVS